MKKKLKNISFLDHLVNLIVVIIGITVAFWLNNWNESKKAAKAEIRYLESLRSDLHENIMELDTLIYFDQLKLKYLDRVVSIDFINNPDIDSLRQATINLSFNLPFTPQSTTYQSLTSSGSLDLISDFELRNKIVEHYSQYYVGIDLWDDQMNKYIDNYCIPYIFDNVNYKSRTQIDPSFISDRKFQKIVWGFKVSLEPKIQFLRQTVDATKQLDNLVIEEINRLK